MKYLKNVDWWEYRSSPDCSWYWKKLVKIKDLFKGDSVNTGTGK